MTLRYQAAGLVLILTLALSGCADRKELALESQKPGQIYVRAQQDFDRGRFRDAAETFAEIERIYPYSEWARAGTIMSSRSYHLAREYELSRGAAERFLLSYPGDEDAALAQHLIALSYYDQLDQKGRDRSNAVQAWRSLQVVKSEYPDSEFAKTIDLKIDLTADRLAAKEMEVGRFYLKQKKYGPAIRRFQSVVTNGFLDAVEIENSEGEIIEPDYDRSTSHTPEALYRLIEAYTALGLTEQARESAEILAYNFNDTQWYRYGYDMLQNPDAKPDSGGLRRFLEKFQRQTIRGKWL
ncbi:MAG: outer membrane protein assembly factor BamD [Rhodobacteraceae bacterium]|nr:outer membrane protein assembly factor BamD [Paracoccaceae bacterium]